MLVRRVLILAAALILLPAVAGWAAMGPGDAPASGSALTAAAALVSAPTADAQEPGCSGECSGRVVQGDCSGSCNGSSISGSCSGECAGSSISGSCEGTCNGSSIGGDCAQECSGSNVGGDCSGTCTGSAIGGDCTGDCTESSVGGTCNGGPCPRTPVVTLCVLNVPDGPVRPCVEVYREPTEVCLSGTPADQCAVLPEAPPPPAGRTRAVAAA